MKKLFGICFFICCYNQIYAQIKLSDKFSLSSYGRLGISTSLYGEKSGSRLNLKDQGSIGGRQEETDYIEISPITNLSSLLKLDPKAPNIKLVLRWAFFSGNNSNIASQTGTTLAEAYIEVDSVFKGKGKHMSLWVGQRYYRYYNVHIADYFFYNNATAQGAGISYHNFKAAILSNVPFATAGNPYGNLLDPFYQRFMLNLQQRVTLNKEQSLNLLGELHSHYLSYNDTSQAKFQTNDIGWVLGALHEWNMSNGNKNYLSFRYGNGIANGPGDDGWSSRTYVTYGNPNADGKFKGAYGVNIVEEYQMNNSEKWNIEAYLIYRYAQGADNPVNLQDYPRANKKQDFTIGGRYTRFITNHFHLLGEAHYQTREFYNPIAIDGNSTLMGWGSMTKLSIMPTFTPTGQRSQYARPQIRLVYSIAFYNSVAKQYRLSDFLSNNPDHDIGMYLGLKTEWWF